MYGLIRTKRLVFVMLAGLAVTADFGCRKDEPKSEVLTLAGTIDKIDLTTDETGKITVTYFSEKQGQEVEGTGMVTKETEIMINGAISKLSDLKLGENVRGEVRVEKKGRERVQTALKIYVNRPVPVGGE